MCYAAFSGKTCKRNSQSFGNMALILQNVVMETHHVMHIKTHLNVKPSSPCSSVSAPERLSGDNVVYKPAGEGVPDMIYLGSLSNFDLIYAWAQDKCVPLVREITFENGEVSSPRSRGRQQLQPDALLDFTSRIGPSLKAPELVESYRQICVFCFCFH